MLTYKATNTKTGRYYIGSAKNYCRYMNRIGNHHVRVSQNPFHVDLQANPLDFIWEILMEDDLDVRTYEYDLLQIHVGDPLCYNKSKTNGAIRGVAQRGQGWEHSEETKLKMRESARKPSANPPHKKKAQAEACRKTALNKSPCPDCGMMLSPGNLAKHLKGTRCKGKPQVG